MHFDEEVEKAEKTANVALSNTAKEEENASEANEGKRKKLVFQVETFFEREILNLKEVFYLSYFWIQVRMPAYDQTALKKRRETGSTISSATIISN